MKLPPSGRQYELSRGAYRAVVVEVGGGIRSLSFDGRDILAGYGSDETCTGARGQLLIPWPNRIEDASYRFDGIDRQLPVTEPATGCAIHGLTRWANWTCTEHRPDQATLAYRLHPQPGWDGIVDLAVSYTLDDDGLTVSLTAHNVGATAVPFGSGAHPYFTVDGGTIDGWHLTLPASTYVTTDDRGLPTGRVAVEGTDYDFRTGKLVGDLALDNPFTDLTLDDAGRAWVQLRSGDGRCVSLWADDKHSWFQVFTGDHLAEEGRRRTAIAIEPMTCPPNAFRTGEDLAVLEPDAQLTLRWGVQASSLSRP